jgi:hypothetical protein
MEKPAFLIDLSKAGSGGTSVAPRALRWSWVISMGDAINGRCGDGG